MDPVAESYADIRPVGAEQEVLIDLAEARQRAGQAQQHLREQWADDTVEVSYTDNPAAFQHAYDEARSRRERGEQVIPYMYEDATDGLGEREGGRAFGVEIEFDLSGADDNEAREAIARDLYAAGLSRHRTQGRYHANMYEGYTDAPNGWRLESDSTVAGEIVSPIMYDEPQTWRNFEKVCEIVRRHGGIATYNTGGHVHVSLHDYDHTVENHNRLLRLNTA
ncbi:amidoligase family protein [Nonomuraea diastatica]|uniref:amidoligase family protein n=1 Tax=Nonomuraea diastatica TaxID=1848329 RepID=UPI001C706376|nr:amidoligase family protein [Nonomuraea diastatica]